MSNAHATARRGGHLTAWSAALERAGFESRPQPVELGRPAIPQEELAGALRRAAERSGCYLSVGVYEAVREPGDPSSSTLRNRLGADRSWLSSLAAAGIEVEHPSGDRASRRAQTQQPAPEETT